MIILEKNTCNFKYRLESYKETSFLICYFIKSRNFKMFMRVKIHFRYRKSLMGSTSLSDPPGHLKLVIRGRVYVLDLSRT